MATPILATVPEEEEGGEEVGEKPMIAQGILGPARPQMNGLNRVILIAVPLSGNSGWD